MQNKYKKVFFLFAYVLFAASLVYVINPPYIINIIIVYFPPSILTYLWIKNSRKKILLFSVLALLLFAPPIELIARLADVWDVASVFPRLFGTAPIENLVYAFINIFWPLCLYEFLIDKDKKTPISKRFKIIIGIFLLLSIIVYTIYSINKDLLPLNYWIIGLCVITPSIIIYIKNPKMLPKVIFPTIFFAVVFLLHEIVSMELGHWWWPGEYVYAIKMNGNTFPLDDAIIWYILSTPALIGGYEFFVDDNS